MRVWRNCPAAGAIASTLVSPSGVNRTQKSAFLVIGLALPAAASGVATPDFRVRIGDAAPADLRLVDRSETADFVLVRLPALKEAGFTGYLVKPMRAASLAAQLGGTTEAFAGAPGSAPADVPAAGATERRGLSVLIAEDNEINALLTRALLTRLGHRPTVVVSGGEALETWRAAQDSGEDFDLVLMDVHMPGIYGLQAARLIRADEAERGGRRTPIVALTASAFAEDRDACLAAGMDAALVKPLDRDRLAALLAKLPAREPMAA